MKTILSFISIFLILTLPQFASAQSFPGPINQWKNKLLVQDDPIFIEFQLKSSSVVKLLAGRLHEEHICPIKADCIFNGSSDEECLYEPVFSANDSGKIEDKLLWVDSNGDFISPTQADPSNGDVQQSTILMSIYSELRSPPMSCIKDPLCNQNAYSTSLAELNFAVSVEKIDGEQNLCGKLHSLNVAGQSVFDIFGDDKDLQEAFSENDLCQPLPNTAVTTMLGSKISTSHLDLVLSSDSERIAIRQHFTHKDWDTDPIFPSPILSGYEEAVYDGPMLADHDNKDWTLFLSQGFLRQAMGTQLSITAWKEEAMGDTQVPNTFWFPLLSSGGLVQTTMVTDIELPICSITLDPVILSTQFHFDSAQENTLIVDATIDWDESIGDIFTCLFIADLFTPGGGPLAYPALAVTGAIIGANYIPDEINNLDLSDFEDADCEQTDTTHFSCAIPFEIPKLSFSEFPAGFGSEFELQSVFGTAQGLYLGGKSDFVSFLPKTPLSLSTSGIQWGAHGNCNNTSVGYYGSLYVNGSGKVCEATFDNPNLHTLPGAIISKPWEKMIYTTSTKNSSPWMPIEYELGLNGSEATWDYFISHPYPLRATFLTTVGSKTIYVNPPEIHQDDDGLENMDLAALTEYFDRWIQCNPDQSVQDIILEGIMEHEWVIDFPPWENVSVSSRDINISAVRYTASLKSLQFESASRITPTVDRNAMRIDYLNVPVHLSGTVVLDMGRNKSYEIGFSGQTNMDMSGVPSRDLSRMNINMSNSRNVSLQLNKADLPQGVDGILLSLGLSPNAMVFSVDAEK